MYAALWEHREGPWENGSFSGPNSGLYKSTDGGTTWRRLTEGLPAAEQGAGRSHLRHRAQRPQADLRLGRRRASSGVYRSDDAGRDLGAASAPTRVSASTFACTRRTRTWSSLPARPSYRSDDGGKTWTCIKGAPGGDDYQRIWINPLQPDIMLFTADQGATITINGGRTWSSWYNQPTAQLYHVTTDNQFPYWIYGGQQESGAIGIASRGNGGQISFRDWIGVGADEYAYVAPDPLDPDIVYGGRIQRFNKKTGQSQNVAPEALRSGKYRILRTMPLLFHPADPKMLLFATNVLWKTTSGGQQLGDHQSRPLPRAAGRAGERRRLPHARPRDDAPPRRDLRRRSVAARRQHDLGGHRRWARACDAGRRSELEERHPAGLRAWDKVSQLDAGHFDVKTAYIAVNAIRRDDMRPHIYRTHDGGATWTRIVDGPARDGPGKRGARGSEAARTALRRHRTGGVLLD